MKLALLADLHFGIRNDSQIFLQHTRRFFDEQFLPFLKVNKISHVVILGDVWDRRKYINIATANFIRRHIMEKLSYGYTVHILAGNHDVYHTNTLSVNSLEEIGKEYTFTHIHLKPKEVQFSLHGRKILMLPWICDDNQEECLKAIQDTDARILMGHLQLQGFEMHVGQFCEHGFDSSLFGKFDLVLSGHFHQKSSQKNIHYLGAPYEMTWADYDCLRGFHTLDMNTMELEYHPNPNKVFYKVSYNDVGKEMDEILGEDFSKYDKCYVKVIIQEKTNPYWFDMYLDNLSLHAADVKVTDAREIGLVKGEDAIKATDTVTILKQFINETELGIDKDKLDAFLVGLYNEALTQEA